MVYQTASTAEETKRDGAVLYTCNPRTGEVHIEE